jgi:hypothetical protein
VAEDPWHAEGIVRGPTPDLRAARCAAYDLDVAAAGRSRGRAVAWFPANGHRARVPGMVTPALRRETRPGRAAFLCHGHIQTHDRLLQGVWSKRADHPYALRVEGDHARAWRGLPALQRTAPPERRTRWRAGQDRRRYLPSTGDFRDVGLLGTVTGFCFTLTILTWPRSSPPPSPTT